jgi:hypothetical protein
LNCLIKIRNLTWFLLIATCGGCASPARAPLAQTAAGSAPEANGAPTALRAAATAGYRRVVRDGQELYCRQDEILGTKIQRGEICRTGAELERMRLNSDEFMRRIGDAVGPGGAPSTSPTGR